MMGLRKERLHRRRRQTIVTAADFMDMTEGAQIIFI